MKRVISFLMLFSALVVLAQNWSSEAEINNYYNDKINQKKAEVSILERQLENEKSRFYYDDNKIFHGDLNAQENALKLGLEIAFLKAEIKSLESARSTTIDSFRQTERQRQIEKEKNEKQKREIEKINQKKAEQLQQQRQKKIDEARAKKAEEDRIRAQERKKKEQERIRKEQLALEAETQANLAKNAPAYYRDLSQYDENARKFNELESVNISEITKEHSKSGYMPSSGRKLVGTSRHNQPGALAKKYLKRKQDQTQNDDWLRSLEIECNKLNY